MFILVRGTKKALESRTGSHEKMPSCLSSITMYCLHTRGFDCRLRPQKKVQRYQELWPMGHHRNIKGESHCLQKAVLPNSEERSSVVCTVFLFVACQ